MKQRKAFITIKAALALGSAIIMHSAIAVPALAQEVTNDTGVYGKNVARADFPGGSYRMIGERKWGRFDENDRLILTFDEVTRDDWAAEFRDPVSGTYATIDTLRNAVSQTDPKTDILTEFAKITSVAPISSNPQIALPTIPDDYPDWYKEAWDKRFNANAAHNQTWQAGASVATGPSQQATTQAPNSPPQFATGPSQSTGPAQSSGNSGGNLGGNQSDNSNSGGGFDPFGGGSAQPMNAPQQSGPQTQPQFGGQGGPVQQSSPRQASNGFPPSSGNSFPPSSGNAFPPSRSASSGGGNSFPPPPSAPDDPEAAHANILGVWVELNTVPRPTGDGQRRAISWSTPKMVRFEPLNMGNVSFLGNDPGTGWNVMSKKTDNTYSNGRSTATITERGSSYFMRISGGQYAGSYEIAKTADGDLSRERFDDSVTASKDSRRGLFNQDGLTREWNTNFSSFDGLDLNLFDPQAGRRLQVFQQPGNFDYAVDDNLNLGLPYGLRGFRTRSSSSRQVETLITDTAAFQKSWSMNFGGGVSTPKVNLGANYSHEQTRGMSSRSTSMSAIGFARIERYILVLDEANAALSENFIDAVERVGRGSLSATQFVNTWGTHYAKAISYGGLGKAEKTMSSTQIGEYLSKKTSVSGSGGAKGASLNGGFSEASSNSSGTESVFTRDEFSAVGGSGSMSFAGWQVSDNDTVPVRYDVRRLSDLITPILMPPKNQQESSNHFQAKTKIRNAIDARMNSAPNFNRSFGVPKFYEIELHELRCTSKGDDKTNFITLRGSLELKYFDDQGEKRIPILAAAGGEQMSCAASGKTLNQKSILIMGKGQNSSRSYGSMWFANNLSEVDDGPARNTGEQVRDGFITGISLGLSNRVKHNADDDMSGSSTMLMPVVRAANGQRRTANLGGGGQAPTLQVSYTIRELK